MPLYKGKGNREECNNYRGISLLSVPSKIYGRILNERLTMITGKSVGNEQGGFWKGRGSEDQIFAVKILVEKYLEKDRKLFGAFMDLEKAYDRADRNLCLSISPMPCPLRNLPHEVAMADLSPGLPVQAFFLSAFQTSPTHCLQYSPTLFIHFTSGLPLTPLPSIAHSYSTFFVHSHSFILITYPHHLSVLCFIHSATLQSIPIAVSLIPNPPYMSSLFSLSHLDTRTTLTCARALLPQLLLVVFHL